MAVDPLDTATSIVVSADVRAGQENAMEPLESLSSTAAQNAAAKKSEPNIEGIAEQENVPFGRFQDDPGGDNINRTWAHHGLRQKAYINFSAPLVAVRFAVIPCAMQISI